MDNPAADFVAPDSIVRRIWGDADTVLVVFAGSAAEFALNRAVDWLFYTGELPRDPIGRLFATARYAQDIAFADEATAQRTLARIHAIHSAVEAGRQARIPNWAYRDVLYMLIAYSERAFHLLQRPLTPEEQEDLYQVFRRVGTGLQIPDLPTSYAEWAIDREAHLERDFAFSEHTATLYRAYRRHLGLWRYALLRQVQRLLVPERVRRLLHLPKRPSLRYLIPAYQPAVALGLRPLLHRLLVPREQLARVRALDLAAVAAAG